MKRIQIIPMKHHCTKSTIKDNTFSAPDGTAAKEQVVFQAQLTVSRQVSVTDPEQPAYYLLR